MRAAMLLIVVVAAACGGDDSSSQQRDAAIDADMSICGHPGDMGNELGIGKFCESFSECASTPEAPLCSKVGDPQTHFCTKTCSATGPANQCGTDTMCTCNSTNQCGCTPTACLGP